MNTAQIKGWSVRRSLNQRSLKAKKPHVVRLDILI